jgi:hypothetical protein
MPDPERSKASARRLAAARRIAEAYAAEPSLLAVLCTGSAARGQADRWSDLELLVVWEAMPRDEQRRRIVAVAGGQSPRFWSWDGSDGAGYDEWWHDGVNGHGLLVEVTHTTPPELASRVEALARGEADPALLPLGDAIVNGVPIIGGDALGTWRARLQPYPRALAVSVVRRLGQIDNFWRWQMYVERGNGLQLGVCFADVAVRVVQVACALSGVWWPGAKWLMSLALQVPIAPAHLAGRLERISEAAPAEAAANLAALVDETYDLVEIHLPEFDVARLRAIFHFARCPY